MLTLPSATELLPPTRAGELASPVPSLPMEASCGLARDAFDLDPNLFAVAIIDDRSRPVGVINRFRFLEKLASRFGRELVLNKPVTLLMEPDPLILDESTHIDEIGGRLLADQNRYIFDGFIVTRNGEYSGMGTGLDLIRALTERRHAELRQMAFHDLLTGLPNRALFEEQLSTALRSPDQTCSVGVLFIDLDRFKEINDTYGHRVGDLVLCGVSERMRAAVRQSDLVARLSGDEFAVVIPDLRTPEDADAVARVLLRSCSAPLIVDGREIVVSCSIGVAVYPQHGGSKEALLRAADTAQYHAKELRNSWQRYDSEMHEWRPPTPALSALRQALERSALHVHYQPVVDLSTGRAEAVEALVRWNHQGAAVSAADIVRLAEESGLIVPLTEYVMRTALEQMHQCDLWLGHNQLRLSINISAVQINEGGLLAMADRLLAECRFDAARLEFEITERATIRPSATAYSGLEALRERGITLTLDDFGTGYSALSRLEGLPIDAMKIDKTFLEDVSVDRNGVIAKAIIAMGHALGLKVVGEGVETPQQLEFLRKQGCAHAQGYLLGRPCAGDELRAALCFPAVALA